MGDWNISIQGLGVHHNTDCEDDADKLTRAFVKDLIDRGHTVSHATFTCGGAEDIMSSVDEDADDGTSDEDS